MGRITTSKNDNGKIIFEVELEPEESTQLKGHYADVHLFTENVAEFETNIATRGKNSCTKYFLIPKNLRKDLDYKCPVNCQKIETKDRTIFIYVVDKICNGNGKEKKCEEWES